MTTQSPTLGRIVLVSLPASIDGQREFPAIVTRIWEEGGISTTVFAADGAPMATGRIFEDGHEKAGETRWRWPPTHPPRKA